MADAANARKLAIVHVMQLREGGRFDRIERWRSRDPLPNEAKRPLGSLLFAREPRPRDRQSCTSMRCAHERWESKFFASDNKTSTLNDELMC
jgi:hypothetical protein